MAVRGWRRRRGRIVILMVVGPLSEDRGRRAPDRRERGMIVLVTVLTVGIPVATGVAIFRYHLYDLNLVVRKTVVYALLAGFVTLVYAGVVAALSSLVGGLPGAVDRRHGHRRRFVPARATLGDAPCRPAGVRAPRRTVRGALPVQRPGRRRVRGRGRAPEDGAVIADGTGAERVEVWLATGDGPHAAASWPATPNRSTTRTGS